MELVSVVVPIYNMESFLPKCMESLLKQTYEMIEIILVDDGSTDKSRILINEYEKLYPKKVRVCYKENGGLSSARNIGIEKVQGKFVIFPDPDDWVDRNYIEELVKIQKKYQCDLAVTGYFVEFEKKSIQTNLNQELVKMNSKEAIKSLFRLPCMGGFAWNKLYCLDIIRNNKLEFLDDVGTTEDLDFAYRYLKYCNSVVFSPETRTYHYYQREGAATDKKFSFKKLESIHTYEKILSDNYDSEIKNIAKEETCNTAINLLWMYWSTEEQDKEVLGKIKFYLRENFFVYMKSKTYSKSRKIQAIMARFMPNVYCLIKNKSTST